MSAESYFVANDVTARRLITRLMSLSFEKPWKITIERVTGKRTVEDNAVIRGMARTIAEFTGEEPDRVYEVLLARRFGTEDVPIGNGRFMQRPAKRVSDLDHDQALAYMRWIEAFAASEIGIDLRAYRNRGDG